MVHHPYRTLPPYCFWRPSIAEPGRDHVDPVVSAKFKIRPEDRVATAGSCFAQHIARHLRTAGFNFFVAEPANPVVVEPAATACGYGIFSARYGNIYTSRQLLQLLRRAYGLFQPEEDVWTREDGRVIDPFRPQIQPDGFASMAEFQADRRQHFAAVRRMVEDMDILVFTLGLTECWSSRRDQATFPLCPGVAGGDFEPDLHGFVNLSVAEIVRDMNDSISFIIERNANARVILTVSPVPLIATFEDRSVLVSTTYSKSVLRVACEELANAWPQVAYFPSYEIITGGHARGDYFAPDLRSVTEAGVGHVMRLFLKHYASTGGDFDLDGGSPAREAVPAAAGMDEVVQVFCDEVALAQG